MNEKVIDLDENREHFVIQGFKAVHVIPKLILENLASGKVRVSDMEYSDDFVPTIILEWLKGYGDNS